MQIRKFEASSFELALARVKDELGPEALIVSTERRDRGWFHRPVVEITAAVAIENPEAFEWDDQALEKVFPHRKIRQPNPTRLERDPSSGHRVNTAKPALATVPLERRLVATGIEAATALDLARHLVMDTPKQEREDPVRVKTVLAKGLAKGIKTLSASVFQSRRCWAAVGPEGSGKTTLIVKLALAAKAMGLDVEIASHDRRKLVGRRELAAYSKLIGVRYLTAAQGERGTGAVSLVDTPSVSSVGSDWAKDLDSLTRDCNVVLVLDVRQRLTELMQTVDALSGLAPVALAFTRVDTATQIGVVYEVLKATKLPLLGMSVSAGFRAAFKFYEPLSLAKAILNRVEQSGEEQCHA